MKRFFPAPFISLALWALWVVLNGLTVMDVVIGGLIAFVVPIVTAPLRPVPVRIRRPLVIARLIMTVGGDVVRSNIEVGLGVLGFRPNRRSAFVRIPLELRDPHGLASLAIITTVVPGTVWSEIALDRSAYYLHVWDVHDEPTFVAWFKNRYERPLREIFE